MYQISSVIVDFASLSIMAIGIYLLVRNVNTYSVYEEWERDSDIYSDSDDESGDESDDESGDDTEDESGDDSGDGSDDESGDGSDDESGDGSDDESGDEPGSAHDMSQVD